MSRAAEETGFVVVLPQAAKVFPGGGTTWNVPFEDGDVDDVGFVETVIEAVGKRLCIDPARIYAAGFSGGARFASELGCKLPNRFAAISAVAGLRHPQGDEGECPAEAPTVPIIAFHSTETRLSEAILRLTWSDCRDGARIEFYRLSDSGHTWPGSNFAFPKDLGATDRTIDATSLTVQFFERFRRD